MTNGQSDGLTHPNYTIQSEARAHKFNKNVAKEKKIVHNNSDAQIKKNEKKRKKKNMVES